MSKYITVATQIGELVDQKQKAYGDAFTKSAEIMSVLYPDGVRPDQYSDLLTVTRIIDKLFRIATDKRAFGESPYRDIAGYGVLGVIKDERQKGDNAHAKKTLQKHHIDGRIKKV